MSTPRGWSATRYPAVISPVWDNGTGLGDLTLVAALWPYADRTAGRYLGLAGYLILPTGDYDPARTLQLNLNPGENRLQWALQAGYSSNLSDRWGPDDSDRRAMVRGQ
jgi:hypothetical protein